jgi:hypothetical protein
MHMDNAIMLIEELADALALRMGKFNRKVALGQTVPDYAREVLAMHRSMPPAAPLAPEQPAAPRQECPPFTDELTAMATCRAALESLTPAERQRCLVWLQARYPGPMFGMVTR